jgi:hypothetical protein
VQIEDIYAINGIDEAITSTQQMIDIAIRKGWFYLGAGMYLYTRDALLEERDDWRDHDFYIIDTVYTVPFWVIDQRMPEIKPAPIRDADDLHQFLGGSDDD